MDEERLQALRERIEADILPLVTGDYVCWGLPYYDNPGDTLIWEGALELLKKCPHRCLDTCGWQWYRELPLDRETVILIIGGGFFGDVWRKAWDAVMDTIEHYPKNPIVILPQSVHYEDARVAAEVARRLRALKRLTVCVRDQASYAYVKAHLRVPVRLVPDLAFHADVAKLRRWALPENGRRLYLKRGDKELPQGLADVTGEDIDCRDWPHMTGDVPRILRGFHRYLGMVLRRLPRAWRRPLEAFAYRRIHRPLVLREAVRFLSVYREVQTTRLHAMILAALLGKEIKVLDNSYGKVSGCYDLWIK